MRVVVVLALAVVLAGCTAPATAPQEGVEGGTSDAAANSASSSGDALQPLAGPIAAGGPFDLHLHPDLTLSLEPAAEGSATLSTPVNGPATPGYPSWSGVLDRAVNLTSEGVPVVLYITSETLSVRANTVPLFEDLPGMFLTLDVGGKQLGAEVEGPQVLVRGEVAEVAAVLHGDTGVVAPGAEVVLGTGVIYSHATTAAEFRFVMGPDHPARLSLPGA